MVYFVVVVVLRERKGGKERETLIGCLPHMLQLGMGPCSLGMCPEWGLNLQLFGVQIYAPTNLATPTTARMTHFKCAFCGV